MPYKDKTVEAQKRKQRYATDPEYRQRILDNARRSNQKHQEVLRIRRATRRATDEAYRLKLCQATAKCRKESNVRLRQEVFRIYGETCVCCGTSWLPYLTLDHVNNDGAQHRLELCGSARVAGEKFYRELRRAGFQTAYAIQVLCQNCHQAKSWRWSCEHTGQ